MEKITAADLALLLQNEETAEAALEKYFELDESTPSPSYKLKEGVPIDGVALGTTSGLDL